MDEDVIQFAETVLQILQRRKKGRAALVLLLPREYGLIKFGGITQFLDPDSELVPLMRVKVRQFAAAPADLLPMLLQLCARHVFDRLLAACAKRFIRRLAPVTDLKP